MLPAIKCHSGRKNSLEVFFSNLGPRLNGETQSPVGAYARLAGRLSAAAPLVHPVYTHAPFGRGLGPPGPRGYVLSRSRIAFRISRSSRNISKRARCRAFREYSIFPGVWSRFSQGRAGWGFTVLASPGICTKEIGYKRLNEEPLQIRLARWPAFQELFPN